MTSRAIRSVLGVCLLLTCAGCNFYDRGPHGDAMETAQKYGVQGGYDHLKQAARSGKTRDMDAFLDYSSFYEDTVYAATNQNGAAQNTAFYEEQFSGMHCMARGRNPARIKNILGALLDTRIGKYQAVKTCLRAQGELTLMESKGKDLLSNTKALSDYDTCHVEQAIPACFIDN